MFAREGYGIIAVALVLAVVLVAVGLRQPFPWNVLPASAGVSLLAFVLFFFRDPVRIPPPGERLVLAPADGRVVAVEEGLYEPSYVQGGARRVSIFLSAFDVHVNRVPADGIVEYVRYVPGDYLVAWHPKASDKNERSEIGIRHSSGTKLLFNQIAGVMAHRIVYHVARGDTVSAGQRFGVIRFGSRMDVWVPPFVVLRVRVGDRVRAGESILGIIPPDASSEPSPGWMNGCDEDDVKGGLSCLRAGEKAS